MTKVCIIYGWAEGEWHGRLLRQALKTNGYIVTTKAEEADILIAHSGGCYMLPDSSTANLIMFVGLPYWPQKHMLTALIQKVTAEVKNFTWLKKTAFNTYYIVTHPHRWYRMWKAWKVFYLPTGEQTPTIITVRNEQDHFMHPVESEVLAHSNKWEYQTLPGYHDDIWMNPEPYVELITKQYKA